ncbi:MAG: 16S rRNA processing protein RimM [Candidatus Eremiobacteraeota bacterium]|nr:16S rRNA processing protein RimM [Candidatus Eremiobacteraeota bacterium]
MTALRHDVVAGRIAGIFGLRGELKCDPTSAGRISFFEGAQLHCELGERAWPVRITSVRSHQKRLLIRIDGVEDADAAAAYAGAVLYSPRQEISLGANEYLDDDLAGCSVVGINGTNYGVVERVEHYPSSDMLVLGGGMVPMVRAIVVEIDLDRRRIVIDPPEGLLDS